VRYVPRRPRLRGAQRCFAAHAKMRRMPSPKRCRYIGTRVLLRSAIASQPAGRCAVCQRRAPAGMPYVQRGVVVPARSPGGAKRRSAGARRGARCACNSSGCRVAAAMRRQPRCVRALSGPQFIDGRYLPVPASCQPRSAMRVLCRYEVCAAHPCPAPSNAFRHSRHMRAAAWARSRVRQYGGRGRSAVRSRNLRVRSPYQRYV